VKNELYSNILTRRKNFTAMVSSRGCPYRCAFCDQKTPKYRNRSAENFVAEIKDNYKRFDVHEFDDYDSTFTANKKRVMEICNLLRKEKLDVSWTVRSRVDSVNKEMLEALWEAGCHTLMYGIESSDRDILKRMRKDISPERVREVVDYSKKIGFSILGFFLLGFPGETRDSIEDTIRYSLELPLDYVQFSLLVPFPDTEIYEYYKANGLGDYWQEYTLDAEQERKIELIGTQVSREEAGQYLKYAYRKFYFRPRILWRRALALNSFGEFKHLASAAVWILRNSIFGSSNHSGSTRH
jgi:anaerobic magnesium-protoporphyrin IX monomethyl ester cyclase